MELRHQVVYVAKTILQNREKGLLGKSKPPTKASLWNECGPVTDTSSQAIEFFIFGNVLFPADLGTCMSCIAHLKRTVNQIGLQGLDARALPILTTPAEDRFEGCYHKTSLYDNFRFARLEEWHYHY